MLQFLKRIAKLLLNKDLGKSMSYEERKRYEIDALRAKGIRIGSNTDVIESTLDTFFPFLISIGDNCIITGATILCHDSSYIISTKRIKVGAVSIGNNCFLGRGVVVLPGVSIGDNCVIGANSTVTRSIPTNSVIAGSPGRVISRTDERSTISDAGKNCSFVENIEGNFLSLDEIKRIRQIVKDKYK